MDHPIDSDPTGSYYDEKGIESCGLHAANLMTPETPERQKLRPGQDRGAKQFKD